MALALTTITNSIAALSVSGVTIFDIDEIPAEIGPRYPAIIPLSTRLFSHFNVTIDSLGPGSSRKMSVHYDLHYRLLYSPVGTGRTNMMDQLAAMIAKAMLFLDAVLAIDTFAGGVDIMPSVVEGDGVVNDPAELPFWGCDFVLTVMEFVN